MEKRVWHPSISTYNFVACGVWLAGVGLYFMLLRPAFLPEDVRFIGGNLGNVRAAAPGLENWLRHVFVVAGGFMAGGSILTIFVALKSSRARTRWRWRVLALAGLLALGIMTTVNVEPTLTSNCCFWSRPFSGSLAWRCARASKMTLLPSTPAERQPWHNLLRRNHQRRHRQC